MGGTDTGNVSLLALKALKAINDAALQIKIVVGPANPHTKSSEAAIKNHQGTIELVKNGNMPKLMQWADLVISAGGSTCWEICYLSKPFIVVSVADNQIALSKRLQQERGALYLGDHRSLTRETLSGAPVLF